MYSEQIIEVLKKFYEAINQYAKPLEQKHSDRLQCRKGCNQCCQDELEVFGLEAALIKKEYHEVVKNQQPHSVGKCAFLNEEGACRIYNARPFVCRTHGLPLRWIDLQDEETVEFRDICPLNEEGEPIETLKQEDCFSVNPFEEKLVELQIFCDEGSMERVKLRDLFMND